VKTYHGTAKTFTFGMRDDGSEHIAELDIAAQINAYLGKRVRRAAKRARAIENQAVAFPDPNNEMHMIAIKLQRAWLREITTMAKDGTLKRQGNNAYN
jgi:hypothetical protein